MAIRTSIKKDWFLGEDKALVFTIEGQNITGWNLSFQMDLGPELVVKTSPSSGISFTNPSSGVCQVLINSADLVRAGTYDFKLRRTDSGNQTILSYGDATVQ